MIYEVTVTLRVEAEDDIGVEIAIDAALDIVSHVDPTYNVKWESETQICGVDCDCENETLEDFAISRLSEKDIINWSKKNE